MKAIFENIPLNKNEIKKRFEIEVNGNYAYINYGEFANHIALIHTEVDPEMSATGAATAVIEKTLLYIDRHNIKLLPICPFVFTYIKRHPDWKRIVSNKFKRISEL